MTDIDMLSCAGKQASFISVERRRIGQDIIGGVRLVFGLWFELLEGYSMSRTSLIEYSKE